MDKLIISSYNNFSFLAHKPIGIQNLSKLIYLNNDSKINYNKINNCYNPAFILKHPKLNLIYVCNESIYDGHISTIIINENNLIEVNSVSSCGFSSCYLEFDKEYNNIININYWNSTISIHPINNNGILQDAIFIYNSPELNKLKNIDDHLNNRQSEPHYHCCKFYKINDIEILFVSDLGLNRIYYFKYNKNSDNILELINYYELNKNNGPRYIEIIENKLYIINELSSSIMKFNININNDFNNLLSLEQIISTIPNYFEYANTCGNILVHPNKKFIYVSNRGHNSIVLYKINYNLELVNIYDCKGITPRHFCINKKGNKLYVANQDSNNVTEFLINIDTGELQYNNNIKVNSPNYILSL